MLPPIKQFKFSHFLDFNLWKCNISSSPWFDSVCMGRRDRFICIFNLACSQVSFLRFRFDLLILYVETTWKMMKTVYISYFLVGRSTLLFCLGCRASTLMQRISYGLIIVYWKSSWHGPRNSSLCKSSKRAEMWQGTSEKKREKDCKWNDAKLSTLFDLHCILRAWNFFSSPRGYHAFIDPWWT